MKVQICVLIASICTLLSSLYSLEKKNNNREIVMSLNQDVYEFILLQLDDTSDSQIVEYYNTHRATCDSVLIEMSH